MRPVTKAVYETTYDHVEEQLPQSGVRTSPPPRVFGLGALASVAGLRDSHGNVPLDFWVPVRTGIDEPALMDLLPALVLHAVDGHSSLRDIAQAIEMSLPQTLEAFFELMALGLVEVAGEQRPRSGIYARVDVVR